MPRSRPSRQSHYSRSTHRSKQIRSAWGPAAVLVIIPLTTVCIKFLVEPGVDAGTLWEVLDPFLVAGASYFLGISARS